MPGTNYSKNNGSNHQAPAIINLDDRSGALRYERARKSGRQVAMTADTTKRANWILDYELSGHFSHQKETFHDYHEGLSDSRVAVANGQHLNIQGRGSIAFRITDDAIKPLVRSEAFREAFEQHDGLFVFKKEGYVPEMNVKLVSIMERALRVGYQIIIYTFSTIVHCDRQGDIMTFQ